MHYVVHKKINLKASPEQVWKALTDPELTRQYFFGCKVQSKWRKGSTISFMRKILLFFTFELKGKILEIERERLLKYELINSGNDASKSIVTDKIIPHKGYVTLDITDDVGEGEGAEKRYLKSEKGWDKVLKGLKKMLES